MFIRTGNQGKSNTIQQAESSMRAGKVNPIGEPDNTKKTPTKQEAGKGSQPKSIHQITIRRGNETHTHRVANNASQ